jgi:hypothetical protein
MQQHMKLAAMNRVLRPLVSRQESARFGIDVVAVEPDQRPFLGRQTHAIEIGLTETEIIELAHRVRLHVDANAERAHLAHRFEHNAGHTDLMQCQRGGEPADTATGNDYEIVPHAPHPD